jgi:paired small multidrug resistance pump
MWWTATAITRWAGSSRMSLPDVLGLGGSIAIALTYFANLQGAVRTDGWLYSLLNFVGASLILVSLYWAWNLPAAVMEGFWALISVYGLIRALTGYPRPR